jgi:hypothetical protein
MHLPSFLSFMHSTTILLNVYTGKSTTAFVNNVVNDVYGQKIGFKLFNNIFDSST